VVHLSLFGLVLHRSEGDLSIFYLLCRSALLYRSALLCPLCRSALLCPALPFALPCSAALPLCLALPLCPSAALPVKLKPLCPSDQATHKNGL
jgi:hypothetical protein